MCAVIVAMEAIPKHTPRLCLINLLYKPLQFVSIIHAGILANGTHYCVLMYHNWYYNKYDERKAFLKRENGTDIVNDTMYIFDVQSICFNRSFFGC